MRISIVLTTHNRPALLGESVASVLAQTSDEWELVIVDDGSSPPVNLEDVSLGDKMGRVRLVRHDQARGLSQARNTGVAAARGTIVTFLDDDDLLAPSTIAEIAEAIGDDIDCLFVKVGCFGLFAPGTVENQERALRLVLQDANGTPDSIRSIVRFQQGDRLFLALLQRLPMAFQRVAMRRSCFARVGRYHTGGFGDLEWNYRAVLRCRTALLNKEAYLVRCEGQSYFSRRDARAGLGQAIVRIREGLISLPEVRRNVALKTEVERAVCRAHFELSWYSLQQGTDFPWVNFLRSCRRGVHWKHLSLFARVVSRKFLSPERDRY